jgi:hypothetical protein
MNAPFHFDPASDAATTPLDRIDVSDPRLYQNDIYYSYFERLGREDVYITARTGCTARFGR